MDKAHSSSKKNTPKTEDCNNHIETYRHKKGNRIWNSSLNDSNFIVKKIRINNLKSLEKEI